MLVGWVRLYYPPCNLNICNDFPVVRNRSSSRCNTEKYQNNRNVTLSVMPDRRK
jgi:hypothetical protein